MNTGHYQTNHNLGNDLNLDAQNDVVSNPVAVEKLNELIRGERSAVETYLQAIEKVGVDPRAGQLRSLVADHERAIRVLGESVRQSGGAPSIDSGAWGTWAETVMGTAKIFGDRAALTALKQGEEHGIKQYEESLEIAELNSATKSMIQNQFIPQQKSHLVLLDQIIDSLS